MSRLASCGTRHEGGAVEYAYVESEPCLLWTVGFHKPDGSWEPESDHSSEREAKRRAYDLNGVESRYVYLRTETYLWTVGEYVGKVFYPEGDYSSKPEATARVMELNA